MAAMPCGRFIDFGCGKGELLQKVAAAGWDVTGVEYSESVAEAVSDETGLHVVEVGRVRSIVAANVVHSADVIEHLTEPLRVFTESLGLLDVDGILLAQGPLEAGPSLFSAAVRPGIGAARSEVLPTHVLQATAQGQLAFFERAGLETIEFEVSEVDWPAPSRLRRQDLAPRTVVLWALRRASRMFDAVMPGPRGNRYKFAGRIKSVQAAPEA